MAQTIIKVIQDALKDSAAKSDQVTGTTYFIDGEKKNALDVNLIGSDINVSVSDSVELGPNELNFKAFSEKKNLVAGLEHQILEVTVPDGFDLHLQFAQLSGDNIAKYMAYFDDIMQDKKRTWWMNFNTTMAFSRGPQGFKLSEKTKIKLTVSHERPYVGDFNAKIFGILKANT